MAAFVLLRISVSGFSEASLGNVESLYGKTVEHFSNNVFKTLKYARQVTMLWPLRTRLRARDKKKN